VQTGERKIVLTYSGETNRFGAKEFTMKSTIFTLAAVTILAGIAMAKGPESLKLGIGESKAAAGGKVTVKFLEVVDDSRCPVNARCVWAGNAKIKLAVSIGKAAPRTVELNSGLEPKFVTVGGYEIRFVDLSPYPGEKKAFPKIATVTIEKSSSPRAGFRRCAAADRQSGRCLVSNPGLAC